MGHVSATAAVTAPAIAPRHLAVIMDGNGRWAQMRGKKRTAGHKAGVEATRAVVENSARAGVEYLTLFAFSTENWSRPESEVSVLMELFLISLDKEVKKLHENGIRVRFVGDLSRFDAKLRQAMAAAAELTAGNQQMNLQIAVNYGGRDDIVVAARRLAEQVAAGELTPNEITADTLAAQLTAPFMPDVDLLIRTGGEQRISNFLLWNAAYAELYFSQMLWPDFNQNSLTAALDWFSSRQRRFGKTGEQLV